MSRHFARRPTRVSRSALIAALSFLVACGGAEKAPAPTESPAASGNLDVHISAQSVEVVTPAMEMTTNPIFSCFVNVQATVGGAGQGTWVDGEFRFYDLRDTTRQIASVPFPGSELLQAFGTGTLKTGDVEQSRWQLTASAPFIGELSMRYVLASSTSAPATTTTGRFRCAPPVPPGSANPPVPQVSVTPSSGTLDVGTPVQITVSGTAPAGAYYTLIRITGACLIEKGFTEQFQTTVSHTISIPLTYPCTLGAPIGVTAIIYDVLKNGGANYAQYPIALVDSQRPIIWTTFVNRDRTNSGPVPSGDYVAPDSLIFYLTTRDNYRVGALYWDVLPLGTKDSLVLADSLTIENGTVGGNRFDLPVPPAWIGKNIQLRLYARDVTGLMSDTITTPLDSIRVH
jgi:hypothetical protein